MAANQLARFRTAQDSESDGFARALAELRSSGKRSHWIWYVFPQLAGLGSSSYAIHFALRDAAEAQAYLADDVLRARLLQVTEAVRERLDEGMALTRVMGSQIDALKLVSSLTLFEHVAAQLASAPSSRDHSRLLDVIRQVLAHAEKQAFPRCEFTLKALGGAPNR